MLGDGLLDQMQIDRRITVAIPGAEGGIRVTSPEVQVLRKLDGYVKGGSISDRQWRDVVGILRTLGTLDTAYLVDAARELGLDGLLADAREQAES